MSRTAGDRVAALLHAWAPASVLVVGEPPGAPAGAGVTVLALDGAPAALEGLGRFDAALVGLPAGRAVDEAFAQLLGRLKNLHAPRILVVGDARGDDAARLRALAFEPADGAPPLWVHDIDRYNPRREWNSPEDWAHPENFDKSRW